jgi:predicted RNA-binding Zn ribbon-like protein
VAGPSNPARGSREIPFVYVGGDPSLDFVNTVDWLTGGVDRERLTSYQRLTRWAEGAGVLSPKEAQALRRRAASRPDEAEAALARARVLRSLLQRLSHEVTSDALSGSACREFDDWLAAALAQLGVAPGSQTDRRSPAVRWRWRGADERLDSLLWPVAWSAARLLTSDETHRIRVCAGPDCGWVYVDRSRNRLRRWCQMKTCGTAAKTRRRRSRRSA